MKIKERGITLIALIVTIIILLILAGVTINVAIGDNGLFKNAKQAVETYRGAEAKEKLNMALAGYMIDINTNISEEEKQSKLLEILSEIGTVTESGENYEVIVDGYVFLVNKENQKIESVGSEKSLMPTSIKIKDTSKQIELDVGQSTTVEIELEPEEANSRYLKYESSNPEIVEIKNGTIKGLSDGTATITIKSIKDESISATCEVTVVKPIEVNSISLDKSEMSIGIGQSSESLKVTINPSNATNKSITWSTGNEAVATVENGIVTGISTGITTVTATSNNGKTATCKVVISNITGEETENTKVTIGREEVVIPAGFTISAESAEQVSGGIVVKDKNDNEWVWVPCTSYERKAFMRRRYRK